MPDDFIDCPRLSRIYYKGKFFNYPLEPMNAFMNLGVFETFGILWSYLQARLKPITPELTFTKWVSNRFGKRLFEIFFKSYTEKVWGISCDEISADWPRSESRDSTCGKQPKTWSWVKRSRRQPRR